MIIGIGSDILDIRRIERTIERHGDRFLERIFTTAERAKAEKRTERIRAATYAKRFQGAWHRLSRRCFLARSGGGEFAIRPAHLAADRGGCGTPESHYAGGTWGGDCADHDR